MLEMNEAGERSGSGSNPKVRPWEWFTVMFSILDNVRWGGESGLLDALSNAQCNYDVSKTKVSHDFFTECDLSFAQSLDMTVLHSTSKASSLRLPIPLSG